MKTVPILIAVCFVYSALLVPELAAVAADPTTLQLQQRGFFHGREYFMVRSGRLQWLPRTRVLHGS
jgi:hypothetical protein